MAVGRKSGAAAPDGRAPGTSPAYRLVPWLVGALWAALPFTAGPALGHALDGTSEPLRLVASAGLWVGWAVGMVAAAVPHPVALTALRVLAPAGVAVAIAAAVRGDGSPLAVGWTVVVLAWAFSPAVGARCVNGPAYPNERRYLLRIPGPLLFGPLVLAWALAVVGVSSGPLLLAARQWVLGAVCVALGLPVAIVLIRSIHNLSRRWAVFVPAGFVLHDPLALLDPVLFTRRTVTSLRPATVGEGLDLTQGAPGLALELVLAEPAPLTLMKAGRRTGKPQSAARVVFTPTRPGAVIDEARTRRIKVG